MKNKNRQKQKDSELDKIRDRIQSDPLKNWLSVRIPERAGSNFNTSNANRSAHC